MKKKEFKKAEDLSIPEQRIFQAREVKREELEKKKLKKPAPSYLKRKQAQSKARRNAPKVPRHLKKSLEKFGAPGALHTKRRGGYYAGRAAEALLKLGAKPKKIEQGTQKIKSRISVKPLKGGWYSVTQDEKTKFKKYRWHQVKRLQEKENRDMKLKMVAAKIGSNVPALKKILKKLEAQESAKVKRFKKTTKYKGMKHKKSITTKRRMKAIMGAMTDLLQIYGSPKALRWQGDEAPEWKKFKGRGWAVKEGSRWMLKTGPDSWEEIRTGRKRK